MAGTPPDTAIFLLSLYYSIFSIGESAGCYCLLRIVVIIPPPDLDMLLFVLHSLYVT